MTKTTLYSPEIQCGGCAGAIRRTLEAVAGIQSVAVDIDAKTVAVEHDAELVTVANLQTRLEHAGFPSSAVAAGS